MSQSISLQRMTLQEEELTNGEARTITVEIRGSLTDAMIAGQGVEIVGVLLTEAVTKGANLENKFIRRSCLQKRLMWSLLLKLQKRRKCKLEDL